MSTLMCLCTEWLPSLLLLLLSTLHAELLSAWHLSLCPLSTCHCHWFGDARILSAHCSIHYMTVMIQYHHKENKIQSAVNDWGWLDLLLRPKLYNTILLYRNESATWLSSHVLWWYVVTCLPLVSLMLVQLNTSFYYYHCNATSVNHGPWYPKKLCYLTKNRSSRAFSLKPWRKSHKWSLISKIKNKT